MYLFAQQQDLPLGPGIEWTWNKSKFRKSVMISQVSFVQIQWLQAMQETDICIDSNGFRLQIQNAYFQNEVEMNTYKVDGYIKRDGVNVFFEFLGKFWNFSNLNLTDLQGVSIIPDAVYLIQISRMPA